MYPTTILVEEQPQVAASSALSEEHAVQNFQIQAILFADQRGAATVHNMLIVYYVLLLLGGEKLQIFILQ